MELDKLDDTLATKPNLMGDDLSVVDIAWLIYEHRLSLAGYPFARLHPHVHAWADRLRSMPELAKEIGPPPEPLDAAGRVPGGKTLEMIAGF